MSLYPKYGNVLLLACMAFGVGCDHDPMQVRLGVVRAYPWEPAGCRITVFASSTGGRRGEYVQWVSGVVRISDSQQNWDSDRHELTHEEVTDFWGTDRLKANDSVAVTKKYRQYDTVRLVFRFRHPRTGELQSRTTEAHCPGQPASAVIVPPTDSVFSRF